VGLSILMLSLGRSALRLLWTWGRRSPVRAAAASFGTAAAVALLTFLWIPKLPVSVAGFESGAIRSQVGQFEPIKEGERGGTIGQAVPPVDAILRNFNIAPEASRTPSPTPTATPRESPTPAPTVTADPVPTQTAVPFVPPPTPAPTRAPTPTPIPTRTP
jgi:hypothetical protein